jgi:hypothetical protein
MWKRLEDFNSAVESSMEGRKIFLTLFSGLLAYSIMVLASFPAYTFQLLGRSVFYLPEALRMSSLHVMDSSGVLGLFLTAVYSMMLGVTVSILYTQLAMQSFTGVFDAVAFIPGVLVSGCAGCGAGILSLIGFSGVVALLPFSGNLARLGGIVLMAGLLARSGDPRQCGV